MVIILGEEMNTWPGFLLYFLASSLTTGSSNKTGLSKLSISSALSGDPSGLYADKCSPWITGNCCHTSDASARKWS